MRSLPPLVAGLRHSVLPLADASARTLMACSLEDDGSARADRLTEALAEDPPLALWAAGLAEQSGAAPPGSIAELAAWLGQNLLASLAGRREAEGVGWGEWVSDEAAEIWANRVAEAARRACAVEQLAAGKPHGLVEQAVLFALLCDGPAWLAQRDGAEVAQDAVAVGPRWLLEENRPPAVAAILARAVAALNGKKRTRAGLDRATCRARGEQVRRRWMAADASAAWLPALTAKLARLAVLENQFADALETEKLEAMAEFAAGAGHEINNPLAVIAGRAQLLLREETDPQRRRELALMNAQAMRVYEMIAELRLFARPPRPELQRVELVALIDRLIEAAAPLANEQEISLCRQGDAGTVEVEADPVQLMVALQALCQNAREAIGRNGHITVTLQRTGGTVQITVTDDGPGIPPDVRRHLFDPYYSARQAGRGLGLGLSKCWRIVTRHGGRIDVQSPPGRGAAFTITLTEI